MATIRVLTAAALALAASGFALGVARANIIDGEIFENDSTGAHDASVANLPGGTPDVTFTVNSPINFASGGLYTIGEFLSSGGATVTSGTSQLNNTMENTYFYFSGTVSVRNGETFDIGHDDGFQLIVDGVDVAPMKTGPTSYTLTSYTWEGPTGTFAFQLAYGECCGAPADLTVTLPLGSVPEPSTWAMMGLGFGALGFAALRRGRKTPAAIA